MTSIHHFFVALIAPFSLRPIHLEEQCNPFTPTALPFKNTDRPTQSRTPFQPPLQPPPPGTPPPPQHRLHNPRPPRQRAHLSLLASPQHLPFHRQYRHHIILPPSLRSDVRGKENRTAVGTGVLVLESGVFGEWGGELCEYSGEI